MSRQRQGQSIRDSPQLRVKAYAMGSPTRIHFPGESLTLISRNAGESERRKRRWGDGGGTSTVIAWHSSAHPLIRQREKPETVQIFGVGVDSVL